MHYSILAGLSFAGLALGQDLISVLESQPDLSTFLSALQAAPEVADVLAGSSDITILAPTDDAFALVPPDSPLGKALADEQPDAITALLAYHVISGTYLSTDFTPAPAFVTTLLLAYDLDGVSLANVTEGQHVGLQLVGSDPTIFSGDFGTSVVLEADIQLDGVTIHKIDSVLNLPIAASEEAAEFDDIGPCGGTTLSTAIDLLRNTGLQDIVDTSADLTIFLPSDVAFEALGDALDELETDDIADILAYHVIAGEVLFSPDLCNATVTSVQGEDLTVTVIDDAVFINNAQVIISDIILSNGVLHVIDQVLNPNDPEVDEDSFEVTQCPWPEDTHDKRSLYAPMKL